MEPWDLLMPLHTIKKCASRTKLGLEIGKSQGHTARQGGCLSPQPAQLSPPDAQRQRGGRPQDQAGAEASRPRVPTAMGTGRPNVPRRRRRACDLSTADESLPSGLLSYYNVLLY